MQRVRAAVALAMATASLVAPATSPAAVSATGGASMPAAGGTAVTQPTPPAPSAQPTAQAGAATLSATGRARAPRGAPPAVRRVIAAGNRLQDLPYRYGGGHASFTDTGYDCSGTVSYALHGARLLAGPLDSVGFASWGRAGPGRWITVYTNPDHAFLIVAGLRLDTSGTGGSGPRWQTAGRPTAAFAARHPAGL